MTGTPEQAALAEVVGRIADVRPHLVDKWEAAAILESLGYTDARVKRELGVADTLTLGSQVFDALARRRPVERPAAEEPAGRLRDIATSAAMTWVYALPLVLTLALYRLDPAVAALPEPALTSAVVALLLSLVVTGGFVQSIARLGGFYLSVKQPAIAQRVAGTLMRSGILAAVLLAAAGGALAWVLSLAWWPYIVIGTNHFIVFSALWLACACLTIRGSYWRVLLAFTIGFAMFGVMRAVHRDPMTAELLATASVAASVFMQLRWSSPGDVALPLPRMPVLLFRVLPHFCYGTAYFAFLATQAAVALFVVSGAGRSADVVLATAVVSFLFASAAIEYAAKSFARGLARAIDRPTSGRAATAAAVRREWRNAIAMGAGGYALTAAAATVGVAWMLRADVRTALPSLAVANAAYLLFAIAALNALVLFALNDAWPAAVAMIVGVVVVLVVRGMLGDGIFTPTVADLAAGALSAAIWSARAVQRRIARADYAVATF